MQGVLSVEQQLNFYRDGYLVLRNIVPEKLVQDARRLLFERMGNLRRATTAALLSRDLAAVEQASEQMGRSASDPRIMDLLMESPLRPLLESAFGAPLAPVRGAQVATLFPGSFDDAVNEAGYRNGDTPFYGWCGHLDGLWNGGTRTPPVNRDLTREEEAAWDFGTGTNGTAKYHPQFATNIANGFTALVGVALSDQRLEGSGNLGVLKGGHHKMGNFFAWQRAEGGLLGPEGPGWPRVDTRAPNKHGLVHYPDKVRQAYRRNAIISADGRIWPKPTFLKVRPGDGIIVHHATPHSGSQVYGTDPRFMVYFRTRSSARPEANTTVYPDALCNIWLEWQGLQSVHRE